MTNVWQTDGKTDACHDLVKTLDNGSTLTNERTDVLTNDLQDQGSNRLVPNAPNAVDNRSIDCICFVTDERYWFRYGSSVEPGSQMEPNPRCRVHFPVRMHVACINWLHDDAPHAVAYAMQSGEMVYNTYHSTWADAMERANSLAQRLAVA